MSECRTRRASMAPAQAVVQAWASGAFELSVDRIC